MKNTFKKFMAGSALIAMLATGSVFAEEAVLISEEPAAEVQVEETENQGTPLVENFRTKFEDIEGVTMVPVRAVAEHFGFNVEWVEESQAVNLSKGAVFVTFAINENSYAFSRMMPQPLESAPVLVNGDTTYVPVSLFEDILNFNIRKTEEEVEIIQLRTVSVVSMDTENNQITVMDDFLGEVLVNITDDTVVTVNGESVMAIHLGEGALIDIEYANFMTMSIPPMTNAITIEVLNDPVEESISEIVSIEGEQITVTDATHGEVVCNITEETKIIKNGEEVGADALEVGQQVDVIYAEFMTMSIPPMTNAVSVTIL